MIARSFGRYPQTTQTLHPLYWRSEIPPLDTLPGLLLPYGLGSSYGDSCLNDQGTLLSTRGLNRCIHFDRDKGVLRAEAGISFADLLRIITAAHWFLPVTPGTQYVTLGGAIANDVHGKNHLRAGSLGRHVRALELLRSSGERLHCSPTENTELFQATIGGLGLTGLITWAEIQLQAMPTPYLNQEILPFANLDEFAHLSEQTAATHEHQVAWLDSEPTHAQQGRGFLLRAQVATESTLMNESPIPTPLKIPFTAPAYLFNSFTKKCLNYVYYKKQESQPRAACVPYQRFFYPLDNLLDWNRLYGSKGFLQYQCVLPSIETLNILMRAIWKAPESPCLTVLKKFGDLSSPGLLSFPKPGFTLALDFTHYNEKIFEQLNTFDAIVLEHGGRLYPAKDARMSAAMFQQTYPSWEKFNTYVDPKFSSSFWRRVTSS